VNFVNISVTGLLTNAEVITAVSDGREVPAVLWLALQVVKAESATVV